MISLRILLLLFFLSGINAQIALPTFQGVHKPHSTSASSLYDFTSHTFTNCGATGTTGPTLANCKSSYDTSWENDTDLFNVQTQGVQEWTVPADGTYRIEAFGAQGGINHNGDEGGLGARMRTDFDLTQGEVLKIVVGQKGVISPQGNRWNGGSGGGGGSFVWKNSSTTLLIVAGGGGGSGLTNPGSPYYIGMDGVTSEDGTDARDAGGNKGTGGNDAPNNGGRGWSTVQSSAVGYSRMNDYGGDGGFGGGGGGGYGTASNRQHSGGGGYSGGGITSTNYYAGGGGGSYSSSTSNPSNSAGARESHGQVIITIQD